jgi:RNA polymerase sigma-54 factor
MALEQRIGQELEENPALELEEMDAAFDDFDSSDDEFYSELDQVEQLNAASLGSAADEMDYSWEADSDEFAPRRSSYYGDEDEKLNALYNTADKGLSLHDYLLEQLLGVDLTDRQKDLIDRIIYNLDESGYLKISLADLLYEDEENPPSDDELEEALFLVQGLDPIGIGARDLKECLLLQVVAKGKFYNFEYDMIDRYLEDLAANRLPKVAKAMDCSVEDVKGVLDFIKDLNPNPAQGYFPEEDLTVIPDVDVSFEEGEFVIKLNNGSLPEIRVSESCKEALKDEISAENKKYLREKLMSADWIIKAIEQRNRTLLNVSREIVLRQKDFFSGNQDRPGPLMMQDVADAVSIDISTVSRAVKDKYANTPVGLICLRDMFTRSVGGKDSSGKETSNDQIMQRIKQLIDNEDSKKPLKDGQIVNLLKMDGISIVRRTVAKYRQNLGIPRHSQRKQY